MKDCSKETLEASRPVDLLASEAIAFCLKRLYADGKHGIHDKVSPSLTYEELIGALLLAKDCLNSDDNDDDNY